MTNATLVKNDDQMMAAVGLTEHSLELRFADGLGGTVPFANIPLDSGPEG